MLRRKRKNDKKGSEAQKKRRFARYHYLCDLNTDFMKISCFGTILCFTLLVTTGCREEYFLTDKYVRTQVYADLEVKKKDLPAGDLFKILDQDINSREKEALAFLYAYMPVGDLTDYDGEFYLKNVRSSFRAQQEMPWGKTIPEGIFRHFVLPVRVNNETLDESRMVFYDELKDRVKGLSLADAALEVNHWCHEKVIYTPSDARTSSALASVKTAYGRCGEESTFAVAALRSVGIPARQVYTPRWAHTDDNHAWVEVWVDGKWYFMGACEPEPVLNLAWFNAPAYRGMLMHTKVFGRYNGPEEVMDSTRSYTEINVIENYAPTAKSFVTVVDSAGKPLEGASVEFKIYNYAEFYTVARKVTDARGQCSLSAGKGDMLVWASKDDCFGYRRLSFGKEDTVTIALEHRPGDLGNAEIDIVPPVPGSIPSEVAEEQKEANAVRLVREDSIRNQYVATFYTKEKAEMLAEEIGTDPAKTSDYLVGSRGNWKEIEQFLRETPVEQRPKAMALLGVISAKDLRDTPASVLKAHLEYTPVVDSPFFDAYILNPRVGYEYLSPYKKELAEQLSAEIGKEAVSEPQKLVDWIKVQIKVREDLNPQRIPVRPLGVYRARVADRNSRDIFFVAAARSLGIPARIERVAGKVQYAKGGQWTDVDFESNIQIIAPKGQVVASYQPTKALPNPKYYTHFTIAKVLSEGILQTLDFEDGNSDPTWAGLLKKPLTLDAGNYLLITGMRMASGKVLTKEAFFTVRPGQTTSIALEMRTSKDDIQVIGSIDAEAKFRPVDTLEPTSILNTTGRGYFILGILGSRQEPTNHAMRDIAALQKEFETWGRSMILLFKDEAEWKKFDRNEFGALPGTITYGIDTDGKIAGMVGSAMNLPSSGILPVFVIADTFGRVVFVSQGYTIGLGEQMMQVIHKL